MGRSSLLLAGKEFIRPEKTCNMVLLAAILYLLLSLLMTFPLVLSLRTHLPGGIGDTYYLHWALSWDLHKIGSWLGVSHSMAAGELQYCSSVGIMHSTGGFWDANIYAPLKRTLAMGDSLLGVVPFALPVWLLTGNTVLCYNVSFLLTFFLSALGMFLLVRHLLTVKAGGEQSCKDPSSRLGGAATGAAFLSGLIYAFCPYRFTHVHYLEILSSQWLPFMLLAWHHFVERRGRIWLVSLGLFLALQILASPYLGAYALLLLTLMTVVYGIKEGSLKKMVFPIGLTVVATLAFLTPFFLPYMEVKKSVGFFKGGAPLWAATLFSFLAAPAANRVWGWTFHLFVRGESTMETFFPGLTPLLLTLLGIKGFLSGDRFEPLQPAKGGTPLRLRLLELLILLSFSLALYIQLTGGLTFLLFGQRVLMQRAVVPSSLVLFFLLLRIFLDPSLRRAIAEGCRAFPTVPFCYVILLLTGCLLTFHLPYQLMMRIFPGLWYLRNTGRIYVLATIAFSVLAGYGFHALIHKARHGMPGVARVLPFLLPLFLLGESYALPLPMSRIPFPRQGMPPVYEWVASLQEDPVIVELPMSDLTISSYLYASTFHWKRMANGHTGLIPGYYRGLEDVMRHFPSLSSLMAARELGVRYILLHREGYQEEEWGRMREEAKAYSDLHFVRDFGGAVVYQVRENGGGSQKRETDLARKIPREGWEVSAFPENGYFGRGELAIDGRIETRWSADRGQKAGDFFQVNFPRPVLLRRIDLSLGNAGSDYPRSFRILVSHDGKAWKAVKEVTDPPPPISSYFQFPRNPIFSITLDPVETRMMKILITRDSPFFWVIYDLNCFQGK